jgi:transposase-like protein
VALRPLRRSRLFSKRWFEPSVIVTCVRSFLRFSLRLRDVVKGLITERGLSVAHTSVWSWPQTYGQRLVCTAVWACEA